MVLRWLLSSAVLICTLVIGLDALGPENIYQCYRPENYALFNRYNRQGMSMDQFIGLLEKLEHSSAAHYQSPQRLASMVLERFRYDGIIDQTVNQDISYLEPFTFIKPENAKFQMIQRITGVGNIKFPEEVYTLEEKCTMHWLLSHSVNETKRIDEDDFCGRQGRRRRSPRRYSSRKSSRKSSSSTSSSGSQPGFVGNVDDEDASKCPLELGVVYSPYGPVAAGTLLAGMAAGLSEQDASVQDTVGHDTFTMDSMSQQQQNLQVNNIWASTIAGDVAQTALHYEGRNSGGSRPKVIGPGGYWNCTYCPHEYSLKDRASVTALSNAEIYGGIDGYLIGSQIKDWSHFSGFSLSKLLRMYYSPRGVSYDTQYRACDRLRNFQNNDLIDQDTLKTQAINFGFAYYASELGHMPTLAQDSLDDGMDALVSAVLSELNSFSGNSMTDDGPGCANVPDPGQQPDDPVCETMADLTVLVDPTAGESSLQAQKIFLSEMALAMNFGWNMSYVQVASSVDGSFLMDKWNYTNKARFACDAQRLNVPNGRANLVNAIDNLMAYYTNLDTTNVQGPNGVAARSNTQTLLIMHAQYGGLSDETGVTDSLNALCDAFPDLNIFTLSDNSNVFRGVQQSMDRRQFQDSNMFTWESSQQDIRDTLVPKVNQALCQSPSRLVYPPCNTDQWSYSYNEDQHKYTYYLTPGHISYLRIGPQQFFSSIDMKLIFETTYGSLQFCISRHDAMPVDGDDGVTCLTTESTSTTQVEQYFSEPCSEDYKNDNCAAIFISIQQNPNAASTDPVNLCTDDECPYPNSIKYTITHQNMRCNTAAGMAASALLMAAAIFVHKLLL